MKAVIDIGSNSVRLMLKEGSSVRKTLETTRLSQGLDGSGKLLPEAMERTARAIADFVRQAREAGADPLLFATEAVRKAENGRDFCELVRARTGARIEVLTGEQEALCGYLGGAAAFSDAEGLCTVDIGGASTELTSGRNGRPVFLTSLPLGVVRLADACGRDRKRTEARIANELARCEKVPPAARLLAVGGTATTLAAVDLALPVYDPKRVHGHFLSLPALKAWADRLFSLEIGDIRALPGMEPKRADVIAGGAALLAAVTEFLGFEGCTVSESDNMEGFLLLKGL